VQSPAQRQQALAALGYAGLREFQAAHAGTETDGAWGPRTHAAMVHALRALGARSPLPIPNATEMLAGLIRLAPAVWAPAARAIARTKAFRDVAYVL
jgi:hypothetical protein